MVATAGILLCLAYCVGLFVVSLLVRHIGLDPLPGTVISSIGLLGLGGLAAILLPRRWRLGPQSQTWLLATLLALVATWNYCWQWPSPALNDVSQVLSRGELAGADQVIWGTVQDTPRQNRAGRGRFWLKADQVRALDQAGNPFGKPEAVSGKVYITAAWERAEPLYPGQKVEIKGSLYAPSLAKNPNGFDFKSYLADNGSFAGFTAQRIQPQEKGPPPRWRLWQLRKRIAKAQEAGLGTPAGPLVSAMALGRQAVNLPYDLQDAFMQAGMAHTLAASGFQVSLMLGVLMALLKNQPALFKVGAGVFALFSFVGLAGAEPSVMRAALMGGGVLLGLALERKVNPLGCLLLAVTLLLVWNPLWIDSVGFRLSVMATFGLMVAASPLTERLDWLPSNLAALVAVPIAAYVWTIPLQLYYFNTLSVYSILLNIVTTPLVTLISLGGMASAVVAALMPGVGSLLAWPLYWPTHLLIGLVNWEVGLPANSIATGHISLVQMLGLYGLVFLAWLQPWCRKRQWIVGLVAFVVATGPLWYHTSTSSSVTVLAAGSDSVLVAQDHRKTLLVNSGEPKTTFYTVLPFLRQAGINRLDWAVALPGNLPEAWEMVVQKTPIDLLFSPGSSRPCEVGIKSFQPLQVGHSQAFGPGQIQSLGTENPILRLTLMERQGWLMLPKLGLEVQRHLAKAGSVLASEVLWWDGSPLAEELVAAVGPRVAIASTSHLNPKTEVQLQRQNIQVFVTERDGAIIWTPEAGFEAYLSSQHHRSVDLDGAS
ncbi:MAG: ComEC/Rec2 family competence protein [Cyanobacteria bacterium Co-bin13]|nr:ComEC/Rec2 family competence protein [Cyanobacteria bacterium Co-bin13]